MKFLKNYGLYIILPLKPAEFQHSKDQLIDTFRAKKNENHIFIVHF